MAVQTQTICVSQQKRVKTWPVRPHDYLYDPCCVLSSAKDYDSEANRALKSTCNQAILPVYRHMFSDLPNYTSGIIQFQDRRPLPWFINRRYRKIGSGTAKVEIYPNSDHVVGPELFKYFRKYRPPNMTPQTKDTSWLYKLNDLPSSPRQDLQEDYSKSFRNQCTQTDYRENETQTDPYSPLFTLTGITEPEILTLASLTWGNGLPVGEAELIMIERARIKRALETSLPSLTKENLEKRLRLIAKIEWNEWLHREKQIEEIHDIKFALMKEMLKSENNIFTKNSSEKLTRLWRIRQSEKEIRRKIFDKIKFRETHKLIEKRRKLIRRYTKPNRIDLHLDPGSEINAPLLHSGKSSTSCVKEVPVKCKYLQTYRDILFLEKFLPEKCFQVQCDLPNLPELPETGYIKRRFKNMKILDDAYVAMKQEKLASGKRTSAILRGLEIDSPGLMEKLEKPPTRPITPEVRGPSSAEIQNELSTTFLQKILRGRAIQLLMHEGKEKCLDLIEELRGAHSLYEQEQAEIDQAKAALQNEIEIQIKYDKTEEELQGVIESFAGNAVAHMLDFLSKELVRLQDERRIHALAILAERQRRIREAEESGLRQMEERRRKEEQEIFREILNVHQKSIDVYLEDVILSGVNQAAHNQALFEVKAMAEKINNAAYEFEERRDTVQSEEMVAELVHSFLLPEIQRNTLRENVRRKQQASLNAAHDFLYFEVATRARTPVIPKSERKAVSEPSWTKSYSSLKVSRQRKPSLDEESQDEAALEDWNVYAPGQLKYYQMRMDVKWNESLPSDEVELENESRSTVIFSGGITSTDSKSSVSGAGFVFGTHKDRKRK